MNNAEILQEFWRISKFYLNASSDFVDFSRIFRKFGFLGFFVIPFCCSSFHEVFRFDLVNFYWSFWCSWKDGSWKRRLLILKGFGGFVFWWILEDGVNEGEFWSFVGFYGNFEVFACLWNLSVSEDSVSFLSKFNSIEFGINKWKITAWIF